MAKQQTQQQRHFESRCAAAERGVRWVIRRWLAENKQFNSKLDEDDLWHEVVIRAWANTTLCGTEVDAFAAWLHAIAQNLLTETARHYTQAKRDLRKEAQAPGGSSGERPNGPDYAADQPSPGSEAARRSEAAHLAAAINELSPSDALVAKMKLQEASTSTIGRAIGRSMRSVPRRIHRVLVRLRTILGRSRRATRGDGGVGDE